MRYVGQEHTVAAPYDPEMTSDDAMLEAFHAAHERAYTFRLPDAGVEMVMFQLGAELDSERVDLPEIAVRSTVTDARIGRRALHLGEADGVIEVAVYDRDSLPAGTELAGPVLI